MNNTLSKIIIHCDISHSIGLGHYTRCKLLQNAFQAYGLQSSLYLGVFGNVDLCSLEYDVLIQKEKSDVVNGDSIESSIVILDLLHKENLNNPNLTYYLIRLRDQNNKIIMIEGLEDDACPPALLEKIEVLLTPYVNESISQKVPCHFFGKEYLLIDSARILDGKQIHEKAKNILITFGGSDTYNQTEKCLEQLQKDHRASFCNITVIAGFLMKQNQIDQLQVYKNDLPIKIVENVENLVEYMHNCDVAITNTGQTRYELAASGVPMMIFPFDDEGYKKSLIFQNLGVAIINDNLNSLNSDMLFQLLRDHESRKRMSNQGKQHFFSPNAAQNIVKKIVEVCH